MPDKEMKIYELSYLLVSSLKEEEVPAKVGNLKEAISHLGGAFISEEYPKLINLAYTIERVIANKKNKWSQGYFGWFKFELSADGISKLKGLLDLDQDVIRFLIIRTVRENTLAPRGRFQQAQKSKFKRRIGDREEKEAKEVKEGIPATAEEIDKKIEELIA
ncbi:hypothetical protein A3A09_00485 [Candidatus Nomurabacteria bacterium RIFCSPLOWO2_01_FULL_42_20]|uniref:Small ribosomal subunit protein bS6 n=1 Tax=Candidatus Nomurabacteria bacterium RIFCSPHIGHO2_01_FULL_42_16 TaxID=1801743 RepID=A0A1F6VIU2_9BACT|nr:MAG: hypothetical protein A2824_02705 [Candidatus Nomurabacteria bacterium RIFCSPHIGHO2_01_FULL_42_16]OGI91899.1 MAG: hypothetical protein A3A09_00485 [Candidatus Nomurabacteria bacterium RIFCSPLOWO2_01_FULL_42_20]